MAVKLICNTFGFAANAGGYIAGSSSSGYLREYLLTGPRSRLLKAVAASSAVTIYWDVASALSIDSLVIARADMLITQAGADWLLGYNQDGSANITTLISKAPWQDLAGFRFGPLRQDTYWSFNAVSAKRVFFQFDSRGTESLTMSKLYVGKAFTFGTEPQLNAMLQPAALSTARATPFLGFESYEVEGTFTLTWRNVTRAKMAEFRALPLAWPLFVIDDQASVIEHKLEHVIIAAPWREVRKARDLYDVQIQFARLRHYA